jgi:hypothetical protein
MICNICLEHKNLIMKVFGYREAIRVSNVARGCAEFMPLRAWGTSLTKNRFIPNII